MLIKNTKYVGKSKQRCIKIADPDGLFVIDNGIVTHNSPEKVLRTFKKTKARVASRMKGNYYGRVILDSSPNSLEDPMDLWITQDAPKSRDNFIVRGSLWEFDKKAFPTIYINGIDKPPVYTPENSFKIFKGTGGELPAILPPGGEVNYAPQDIIDVPNSSAEGVNLRESAEEDLLNFIRDQAAIPTEGSERVFYDLKKIDNIFTPKLKSLYYGITASAADDPRGLIWNKVAPIFFKKSLGKYSFWYKPSLPRTLSVDQSTTKDVTCIAISHKERDKNNLDHNGNMQSVYITDMIIVIIPKAKEKISLDAIRYFIEDLIVLGNMNIVHSSFDNFQSDPALQYLTRKGINNEKLSVDFPNDPYLTYINYYFQERLKTGPNIFLKNNILSIQETYRKTREGKKGSLKYDHTIGELINAPPLNYDIYNPMSYKNSWTTCKTGTNAKDALDACVASVYLLDKYNIPALEIWDPENIQDLDYSSAKNKVLKSLSNSNWRV